MRARYIGLILLTLLAASAGAPAAENPLGPPLLPNCLVSVTEEADVAAQEPGVVVSIKVHEGQRVAKGDLLAQIDDAQSQLDKRKAQAEKESAAEQADNDIDVRYATAAADVAKYTYLKNKEAYDKVPGAVPWVEVMRLKLEWDRAVLAIEQAKFKRRTDRLTADAKGAEADMADEAIRRRQIKAPFDGVVTKIVPHAGEWVKPGDTICHLMRMDRLQVEGVLNSEQYSQSEIRDRPVNVSIKLKGYAEPVQFTGRIVTVDSEELAGHEYRVKAEIDNRLVPGHNDEWLLHPGVYVSMRIDLN